MSCRGPEGTGHAGARTTPRRRLDGKLDPDGQRTLAHAGQPHAGARGLRVEAGAIVANFEDQTIPVACPLAGQPDPKLCRPAWAPCVRQRFLHDAIHLYPSLFIQIRYVALDGESTARA